MSGLAPCPHCGVAMGGDDSYMIHPKNDCFWSGWEFDQPNVAAWNRRAPLPAEQPSNPVSEKELEIPYDALEAMYFDQCKTTDMWAAKAEANSDNVLLARIAELERDLATMNERYIEARIVGQQTKGGGNG